MLTMQRILLPVVAALGLATGCYHHGDVGVGYSYGYATASPSMYYVSPGVSVVAYSDYPVFYSDNYYWRYDNGLWYRSNYYGGGWVAWNNVPYSVRRIERPHTYARFTPGEGWTRGSGGVYVRDHRYRGGYQGTARTAPGPAVRDHRTYQGAQGARTAPGPAVRDHRAPRPQPSQAPAPRDHRGPAVHAPAPSNRQGPPAPSGPVRRDHRR
jgi:hypothetical protein